MPSCLGYGNLQLLIPSKRMEYCMRNTMKATCSVLLLFVLALIPAKTVFSQSNYPPDIQRIKQRGTFIVAMTATDEPPFFYKNSDGQFVGLDVDISKAIAKGLGVKVVFNRSAKSFNDLIPIVVSGKADAAISKLSITLSRAEQVSFSHPYIIFHQALILNRLELAKKAPTTADIINFIKNFTGKIGVIKGSSYVAYAKKNFPHATIVEFSTWEKVVDAVFDGSILAGYRDEMEIKKIIRSRADSLLKVKTIVLKDTKDDIGIAVAPQNAHLLYWINLLLDRLNLNLNADKLLDRYPDIFKSGQ